MTYKGIARAMLKSRTNCKLDLPVRVTRIVSSTASGAAMTTSEKLEAVGWLFAIAFGFTVGWIVL